MSKSKQMQIQKFPNSLQIILEIHKIWTFPKFLQNARKMYYDHW